MSSFDKSWREFKPTRERPFSGELLVVAPMAPMAPMPKKRGKYGAVPHCVLPDLRILPADECGAVPARIRFDSKKEAERFVWLRLEVEAGRISDLTVQRSFPMHVVTPQGVKVCIARYLSDFTYTRDGRMVVEDVKGGKTTRTDKYLMKKKHVEAEYGIEILET